MSMSKVIEKQANRQELLSIIESLTGGLADKADLPQSMCFVFDGNRIYTYNDNVGVCAPYDSGISCAVPSAPLLTFLRKLKKDDIMLSYSKGCLTIKQGTRVTVSLEVNSDITLPFDKNIKPPEKMRKLGCTAKQFAEGVKKVLFTVCDDTQTIQLCGVHVGSDAVGTFIESSNRYRLTRCYISPETKPIDLKIPINCALALCTLNPISCGENQGWLYFKCENDVQYACWTSEAPYPDLKAGFLAATEGEKSVKVTFPSKIMDILDMASVFAVDKISRDGRVVVAVKGGKASINTKGDYGTFKELCKVEAKKDVTFKIHPKELVEALELSDTVIVGTSNIVVSGKSKALPFWHLSRLDVEEESMGEEDGDVEEDGAE